MKQIFEYLSKKKSFIDLIEDRKDINCINDESFAFFAAYRFLKSPRLTIIVTDNLKNAQNLNNILQSIVKDKVYMYSVDEITKFTSLATSPELLSQRIYILNKIINKEEIIVITHTMAIKRLCPSADIFKRSTINIKIGDNFNISSLLEKLINIGYKSVLKVTQPMEYSTRGGVIDIFTLNYENPIRIEFFDTEVDSIRFFDVDSQRTINKTDDITILPATEFLIDDLDKGIEKIEQFAKNQIATANNNLQLESIVNEDIEHLKLKDFNESYYKYYSFFDTYSDFLSLCNDELVYLLNIDDIKSSDLFIENETVENVMSLYEDGASLKNLLFFYSLDEVLSHVINKQYFSTSVENSLVDLNFSKVESYDFSYDLLYKHLIELLSQHYYIYIGLDSITHYNFIKQFLDDRDLKYNIIDEKSSLHEGINLSNIDLNIGLDFKEYKLAVIGEAQIFKKRFKSVVNQFARYKNAVTISSVNDLSIGDYLVHEYHGIGVYEGIETMLNNGIHRDYLKIKYKNNSSLYLPLEQFKLVRKYVSKDGVVPRINTLGSTEWEKTKKKIKERVSEVAEKLVKLYSLRVEKPGFTFLPDDDLQEAFEQDFGYELTSDQKNVLDEIKNDMEKPIIMDRLLVGDVGFGKTEIAFRAAFKAINSGKQVALLCPTTLLARQHYLTAIDRFKNFPIRIRLISRLVSESEQNKIINELKDGSIDFIIGTHRILSFDIKFKDIGLLIVDEEHKFGVEHKEKIKEFKQSVDVLTLSATPIPRTLQMALTGVRGFSTINTPIENRMPVQTYVIRKDKHAIKEIIERELARNGQVFYLNNKIEQLPRIADELTRTISGVKVGIAHGKLPVEQMEDIMQQFVCNEFNVLLCTTIIENGIDIPNVNTIIVENADCFGLSQLYQIKGRVGRSDKLAYAYLMYKPDKNLSEIAKKRLQTIKEFTALGSGYKVAMRDLITRGAGDLLGEEQSGFIDSVGIDMYIEMLHDAIEKKRNDSEEIEIEKIKPNKTLNIDAYIPPSFFNNDYEKIELYKRIDKIKNIDELNSLKEEMIDKSGRLPDSILMLFEKKRIDIFEYSGLIDNYDEFDKYILINLTKDFNKMRGVGVTIFELANSISNAITLKFSNNRINVQVAKSNPNWLNIICQFMEKLEIVKNTYKGG